MATTTILSEEEWAKVEEACTAVPPMGIPPETTDYPDYMENLFLTVLDLMLDNTIVYKAILYYRDNREDEIQTLDDLGRVLASFPDDRDGNEKAAQHLWDYKFWNRVGWLRGLVRWAREMGLADQEKLREWAHQSDFHRDFEGRAKGLGIAAYCWLVMRLGVDTVKPDVMLHRFVRRALGPTSETSS
jgi:hypothetical protein